MMMQTTDDRISILRESLCAGPGPVVDLSGAFQIDFEPGRRVYVYIEAHDGAITARYETREADAEKRRREIETVHESLQNQIPVARMPGFRQTQQLNGRFIYTTGVDIDPEVFYRQTIMIGDAAMSVPAPAKTAVEKGPAASDAISDTSGGVVAEAMKELEAIDAKTLRQGLDMMNLKRSSVLRIALTRIFRSVGDMEELTRAISHEAGKIVSPEDQEDLRMMRMIHGDGFLRPAIDLLYEAVFNKS